MIQIEIDWSGYTDYKVNEFKKQIRCCRNLPSEEAIEEVRRTNQQPTYSVYYGINPNHVESYWEKTITKETDWHLHTQCTYGVASGTRVINITFTSGRAVSLFCYDDAADKIVNMLQGEKSDKAVKVKGIRKIQYPD